MKPILLTFSLLALFGCSKPETPAAAESVPEEPERRTESVTLWSTRTELFMEYPELVQNEGSRFAIHLTRLSDFHPVSAGRAEVRLVYADGTQESFTSDPPSRPGIFGATVIPTHTGVVSMEITLNAPDLMDKHLVEGATVYATLAEAPTGEEPATEELISFLKEQQWAMDFATAPAETGSMRESIVVPAEVMPRSGGQTDVTAPIAGRLIGDAFPVLGARVTKGQVLASVVPPTSVPNDRAALDLPKAEAETALAYAKVDRDRAARLVEAGAAPRKRLDEANNAVTLAQVRLDAAERRIEQFEASRSAEGTVAAIAIRAPISGTIIEATASPGSNLKGGEPLFNILDTERFYVAAIVPEAEYPKARLVTGAEIEIPGDSRPRTAGRLISIGKVVDAPSRTFPIVYEFANADNRIAVNQTVTIRLFLGGARRGIVIPETALVDDRGRPIVFIQREGESFLRQPVDTGYRQSGMVEITKGLQSGDRVVVQGGYLIRLATLSTQIPAHGHMH